MKIFDSNDGKSILNADLKNTTDRRLLLGVLHRDNDLEPRKMTSRSAIGGAGVLEMNNVRGSSNTQLGDASVNGVTASDYVLDIEDNSLSSQKPNN